ncbi:RecB family exonuclease [Patescibacteria group bacterium]
MRISYSGLESFISCPAKYKYQYIDRIRTSKAKEAVFGTLIHECLKIFHTAPLLEDNLLKQFTDKWNSDIYQNKQEESFAFHQGIEILKNYYINNNHLDSKVIDLETSFTIPLGNHQITGRIDRIDKLPDNTFEIIDYKTSKKMPPQETIDNNLQLSVYNLGLLYRWPVIRKENKKVKLSLYYVRHGEKLSTNRTNQQLKNDEEKILDLISQIEQSNFDPKSNPLCDWCQYQQQCPLFRHKFINQQLPIPDQQKIKEIIKEYFEIKTRQTTDAKKIVELKTSINQYCDENNLDRIFGDEGYITRLSQQRFAYDLDKIKNILEPLGKWQEVLTVDNAKLKKLISSLSITTQKEIEKTKKLAKEFKVLTASKNS